MLSIATHRRRFVVAAGAALAVAAIAAPAIASADTFCVHNPSGCVGSVQPDLKAALASAASNGPAKDTIRLGAGSFTDGPAVDAPGNPVDIVGTSAKVTTLLGTGNGVTVLKVLDPYSTVSDLGVKITGTGAETGIDLAGKGSHLNVINSGAQAATTGVALSGAFPWLDASSVALSYGANDFSLTSSAVRSDAIHSTITDSDLSAMAGVLARGQIDVMRSRVWAQQGLTASAVNSGVAYAAVSDTSFRVPGPLPSNYGSKALAAAGTGLSFIDADRITAYGGGKAEVGVEAGPNAGAGNQATIHLRGSVIDGFSFAVYAHPSGGATATVTTDWSAYKLGSTSVIGGNYTAAASNLDLTGNSAGFVDPAGGDLRLRHDSPLVDRGDPAFQPPGAVDRDERPRLRDGDGATGARVDIGALEYQRTVPVATATATPATVDAGQTIGFDGQASDADPGETATYQWAFDDGASATGAAVQHAFASPGTHTAALTVSDPTGQTATAQTTVTVNAPAGAGSTSAGSGSGATVRAPGLTGLRLSPTTFRARGSRAVSAAAQHAPIGTSIKYLLSKPAAVTFAISRASAGRRVAHACRRPTSANRRHRSCTRWLPVGTFTRTGAAGTNRVRFGGRLRGRALAAGRYRLTVRAADSSGMRSATLAAAFRIVR
jgi:PKD repeat protein